MMNKKLSFQEKLLKITKNQKKKTNKHVLIALPIVIACTFLFTFIGQAKVPTVQKNPENILTASFVGDIMFGRNVEKVTDRYGKQHLFRYAKPYFDVSDYVTGNFEHPVASDQEQAAQKNIHLKTDEDSVKALKDLKFSALNFANNHAADYGEKGLNKTIDAFEQADMDYTGAGRNLQDAKQNISYKEVNGVKIATLGFTDVYGKDFKATNRKAGILPADPSIFIPMISQAAEKADVVVVHAHWGQEYNNEVNDRQRELARAMSKAGADIIIGAHPHVLEPMEVYNGTAIFYSLGNFIFDQGWSRTRDSALVQYHLNEDGKATFEVVPMYIKEATPAPVKAGSFESKSIIRMLTNGTNADWKEKDGHIFFEVDHADKVKHLKENGGKEKK